jgi:N-acetylglucosaminyldiphosphoundecaprenol N-acetyl-beta-D-mannosaminyltransferase
VRSERELDRLVWAWGAGAATVSFLGFWQFLRHLLGQDPTLFFDRWVSAKTLPATTFIQDIFGRTFLRPPSTFIDVNTAASFVGIFLILGGAWWLATKERKFRLALGGMLLVSLIYFGLAVSRTATLGLGMGILVIAYLNLKERISKKVLLSGLGVVLFLLLGGLAYFTITDPARLASLERRESYAQSTITMLKRTNYLGVGAGNFEPYYTQVLRPKKEYGYSHSIFLTWMGEMGILGLAANLFLIGTLIVFLVRAFKNVIRESAWRWKISGLLGGFTALVFANVFHAHYGLEFTWVLLGLIASGYYLAKELNPEGLKSPTLRVDILGVKIDNVAMSQALDRVNNLFRLKEIGKSYIVTPNPEMVMLARRDESFRRILNEASLAVPDGVGLVWGSRILGTPLAERVTGTDLFFELCAQTARRGGRVFFLEGPEGLRTSAKAAQVLKEKFPKLNVGTRIADGSPGNDAETVRQINQSTTQPIDLLFVAYGHGNQERWIKRNLSKLNVKVGMGVGGAFDFIAGVQVRAPRVVRSLGLEWFYRLTRQHKGRRINRLKRQVFALIPFIFLIFKESWKD